MNQSSNRPNIPNTSAHTRRVKWLKLLLPIFGLILIIIAFFVNWSNDTKIAEQFDEEDTKPREEELAVEKPEVNIRTNSGDSFRITAGRVRATDAAQSAFAGDEVAGDLNVGGSAWSVRAGSVSTDAGNEQVLFENSVKALVDGDVHVTTEALSASTNLRLFSTDKPVTVQSRGFEVRGAAGEMRGEQGSRVLKLSGEVQGSFDLSREASEEAGQPQAPVPGEAPADDTASENASPANAQSDNGPKSEQQQSDQHQENQ